MNRALFTAASGMHAQQTRMDVTANNIANVNTTGFKRARAEFESLLTDRVAAADTPQAQGGTRPGALEVGLGVKTVATTRDFRQGDMIATGNATDLVVEGRGFFHVERADGTSAYTRAGNFRLDGIGRMVTQSGERLAGDITVPEDASDLIVRADGTVTVKTPGNDEPTELGRIELVVFQNPAGLHAAGGNLFEATGASGVGVVVNPGEDGAGQLTQGFLEGANVKQAEEMISLIATQRAYEMNAKVITAADEMMQRLGQIG